MARKSSDMSSNKNYTIGVEEEYMICDPNNFDLIEKADQIMSAIDESEKDRFSYELLLSEIEANTPICNDVNEAISEVLKNRLRLKNLGKDLGFKIGISGTHPTALPEQQKFVNNQSYNWVTNQLKEYARQNITFSTHIHIGLESRNDIIKALNFSNAWIAPFIALSANSPFFGGVLTGMESSRTFQFGIFPRTNILHKIESYEEYCNIKNKLIESNSIAKPRHIWWKIRPHFEYNTIEFRVCDIQRSLQRTKMFIALTQALVHSIVENEVSIKSFNMEFLNDSIWKASTKGISSRIIDPFTENIITMKDMIKKLLDYVEPSLVFFNNQDVIETVNEILSDKTESQKQIEVFNKHGFDGLKSFLVNDVEYKITN